MDFTSPFTLARFQPSGIDNTEHSTKITYYTPKIGNDENKVQLGVSYIPNLYDYGSNVVKTNQSAGLGVSSPLTGQASFNGLTNSPYQDVVKGAAEYWANYHPVHAAISAQLLDGNSSHAQANGTIVDAFAPAGKVMDFTAWGLGAQIGTDWVGGLTFGGSYVDLGRYNAVHGQNKAQNTWTVGGKYEFDKVGVALNYLGAEGYNNLLAFGGPASTNQSNYVTSFNGFGAGATYTWFPGLTSALDGVAFQQHVTNEADHNDGYVVLVSQKLTF